MGRAILAVIVSYVVMFLLTSAVFIGAYLVLGADQAFKPSSFQASNRWIVLMLVVYLVVGVIGGFICSAIAKAGKARLALAILVLVLTVLLSVPSLMAQRANPGGVRRGDIPMMEAMQKARKSVWVPFAFALLGAVGVLIGGKLKSREG